MSSLKTDLLQMIRARAPQANFQNKFQVHASALKIGLQQVIGPRFFLLSADFPGLKMLSANKHAHASDIKCLRVALPPRIVCSSLTKRRLDLDCHLVT